jgi:hypothetical protein
MQNYIEKSNTDLESSMHLISLPFKFRVFSRDFAVKVPNAAKAFSAD